MQTGRNPGVRWEDANLSDSSMDLSSSQQGAGGRKAVVSIVLDEDAIQKDRRQSVSGREKPSSGQISRLLSAVYAVTLVVFGVLFPMTEAINESWLETWPNGIFLVYQYSISIVFLIYMQLFIVEPIHDDDDDDDDFYSDSEEQQNSPPPKKRPTGHSHGISGKAIITSSGSNADFTKTPNGLAPPTIVRSNSTQSFSSMHVFTQSNQQLRSRHTSTGAVSSDSSAMGAGGGQEPGPGEPAGYTVSLDLFTSVFEHEGSSFYLRLGTMLFTVGNIIYVALEIEYHMGRMQDDAPEECMTARFGWTFILRLIWIVVQTFFIFKNPKIHVTKQEPLVRFGIMHLIATNLCMWVRTLTNEIQVEYYHKYGHSGGNSTDDGGHKYADADSDDCDDYRVLLGQVSPYLFPFVLEYSLICMGTFLIMYEEINHHQKPDIINNIKQVLQSCTHSIAHHNMVLQSCGQNFSTHISASTARYYRHLEAKSQTNNTMFRKSHRGTVLGFIVMSGMFVSIVLFFYYVSIDLLTEGSTLYLISDIVLHSLMLIATVMAFFEISKLSHTPKDMTIDDMLLFLSMAGCFFFEMSIVISTSTTLVHDLDIPDKKHLIVLSMVSALLSATHSVLQLLLLVMGLRMYSATHESLHKMPGRSIIVFLLIGNITLWVFRTMQVKELEMGIQEEFYGTLGWLFILNINLPLQLFFFFHSSVCFADIWSMAYKPIIPKIEPIQPDTADYDVSPPDSPMMLPAISSGKQVQFSSNGHVSDGTSSPTANSHTNKGFYVGDDKVSMGAITERDEETMHEIEGNSYM